MMIAVTGLRAVLWDMDGTLVDSEKVWDVSLFELAGRLGGRLSGAARRAMVGANMAVSMHILYADLGIIDGDVDGDAGWLDDRTIELFAAGLTWRPGAQELLAEVRAAGLPTALVTSTNRPLVEVALGTLGAANFDVLVCGGESGAAKPDPAPYLDAAAQLGIPIGDTVVIEDSPVGVSAGLAAGARVLGVPCAVPLEPRPELVLRDSLLGVHLADLRALR